MITSPALRAIETARFIARALQYPLEDIKIDTQLYQGNSSNLADQFYDLSDQYESVMMVGHNPSCTSFANIFLDPKIDSLPTSGIVCIAFETDHWEQIFEVNREMTFCITPKSIQKKRHPRRHKPDPVA